MWLKWCIGGGGGDNNSYRKGTGQASRQAKERDKVVIFKNYVPFPGCISKINSTQLDNTKDLDVVMLMHNLIEYSDSFSKTSGGLCKHYRYEKTTTLEILNHSNPK